MFCGPVTFQAIPSQECVTIERSGMDYYKDKIDAPFYALQLFALIPDMILHLTFRVEMGMATGIECLSHYWVNGLK
jgi:hypothetical protein